MNYETLGLFVITLFAVSITPGPSMILALSHGIRYGAKATLATASGATLASSLQATVSIIGLGVIIATSAPLFMAIKILGALYLVYLGVKLWRAPAWDISSSEHKVQSKAPLGKMFNQGFLIAIGNPKAIVFFTALFPQFIDPQMSSYSYYAFMVSLTASSAFICAMIYAVSGQQVARLFKKSNISAFVNKITGGFFVGGGVAIVLTDR